MTTETKATQTHFPWILTLFVVPVMALLIALGVWQVQRLEWKQALIADIEQARSAEPIPLMQALAAADRNEQMQFRRVSFQCVEVGASSVVQMATTGESKEGDAVLGHRYIYACPVAVGPWRSVLVDAGFNERDEISVCIHERGAPLPTLIGALRSDDERNPFLSPDQPENRLFYARDISAMAASIGAPAPAPYMVVLEQGQCWAQGRPSPLPTEISNNHLGYAITWFGLALTLLGFYVAMLRRKVSKKDRS